MRKLIRLILASAFIMNVLHSQSQDKPRVSPAARATGISGGSNVTITYSQPSVKGRKIWGELVPFDKVWRTGANEATVFETTKDIKVEGKTLSAGKYGFFTIPGENEWTVVFNKTWDQWGSGKYNDKEDQLRIKVKAGKAPSFVEQLTFFVEAEKVFFRWENAEVGFKVKP